MNKVLFVNHRHQLCGVHQYGFNVAHTIKQSSQYSFVYCELENESEFDAALSADNYCGVIYNYHPSTLPWAGAHLEAKYPNLVHIGIVHEPMYGAPFKYKISQDPSEVESGTSFKQYSRNIFTYTNVFPEPAIPTIGSFGFAWADKGFERMVEQVKKEFGHAKIRLHLPKSHYGDPHGYLGDQVAMRCLSMLSGTNIQLELSRDWKSLSELLDWLAQNSINAFFYDRKDGRGISGPPDFALAVRRPIALTKSYMFKHLWGAEPSVFIEDLSLKQILSNGLKPLEQFYAVWSEGHLTADYNRIVTACLENKNEHEIPRS